jgi:RNA polymerase sigma-70 factor, ECF subfamily
VSAPTHDAAARAAAEAAVRRSYGKLVAFLAARSGDLAAAEDALSEALAAALSDWPANGCPANPEAWLLTVARRRLIDAHRRRSASGETTIDLDTISELVAANSDPPEPVPDHRLRLMFACAHPAIDAAVRAPLMLQTLLGFDAVAIGSAFLVAPATMGQRLVRAKAKIRQARIPLRVPEPDELGDRLAAVLDAIYACFAEGWADPGGADARRRDLGAEGLWLSRLLASLLPGEPEVLGLLALVLHAEARRRARRDAQGAYVPLSQQDPMRWDAPAIDEAEALLRLAAQSGAIGRYQLEAAVQSAHAARRVHGRTDWPAIVRLYDALWALTASPVVALNRAVALGQAQGAAAGLAALEALAADLRLADYQPYWAARADLLARTGATAQAALAYERAIGLEPDPAVRQFLQASRAALG